MREIQYMIGAPDWGAVPYLLTGLPMLGPADPVDAMMERYVPACQTVEQFAQGSQDQQRRVLSRVKPSGDDALDTAAYEKSRAEKARGVLDGPFRSLGEVPYSNVCVVPRHGVWEMHGSAEEMSVRVVDDMLVGEQNDTVSYSTTHRPAGGDALCSQQRAVQERSPTSSTGG